MPQARLPDINSQFMRLVSEAITSLKSGNYGFCFGSLYALNGLLPKDYRVRVSSIEYDKLTKPTLKIICPQCKEPTEFDKVKKLNVLAPEIEQIVGGVEYVRSWVCPGCNTQQRIKQSEMVNEKLKDDQFLHVVPKPPSRKEGLSDKTTFHNKVERWVWLFLDELLERMAQFRDDNWQKKDDLYGEDEMDQESTGEEDF